ncbi:MAG: class I tRNA ligase family protein, partial [Candidatus Thorarchaeota archaeon]
PMSMRPQSHDIIRTWAFYTILRSHLLCDSKPWNEIMMGGFILAPDGTPMHASKNNVIDPLEVLDKYGADSIRYYAATCALGKDNAFRWKDVTEGVRFTRKFWNVQKLMCTNIQKLTAPDIEFSKLTENLHDIDKWILNKYSTLEAKATEYMDNFQFDKTRKIVMEFIWHELADHYLELVKYRIYDANDKTIDAILFHIGLGITKLLAPLLPHITEEVYQQFYLDLEGCKSVHQSNWPKIEFKDDQGEANGEIIKNVIRQIRHWKSEQGIPLNSDLNYVGIITTIHHDVLSNNKEDIIQTIKTKNFEFAQDTETSESIRGIKPIYSALGPEFKGKSKEIISKLEKVEPEEVHNQLTSSGQYILKMNNGETVNLTFKHVSLETTKQVHGRDVDTIDLKDMTILIQK